MELSAENNRSIAFLTDVRYRTYRNLVLQLIILLISVGIFFDAPDRLNLSFNRFCGWITYYLFMNMLVYVNVYLLFPYFLSRDKIAQYGIAVVLFTFFSLVILVILQDLFYDIAVSRQEPSFGAIFLSVSSSFLAIILFILGTSTLLLFKPLIYSNIKEQKLKNAATESELKFLKSQINPHFLFNTINNANILVDDEPEMASHILIKLDDLLKYQFIEGSKDQVCLKDDIRLLTDYLELEKVRRDQLEFTIDTASDIDHVFIAPFLFIPFVENAVKHSFDSDGASYIKIAFQLAHEKLVFICENSKPAKPLHQKIGGIGLKNISRRLDLLYENSFSLEKKETKEQYTVRLTLKL